MATNATDVDYARLAPDFDGVKQRLAAVLASKPSWAGLLPTQTGTTIIDMIATVGASSRVAILRAHQDSFPETAMSDRALYANADAQGIRISRMLAAQIPCVLTYTQSTGFQPNSITLPQFTQFQGAGTYWYTRQAYVLNTGSPVSIALYQGYIVSQTTGGLGTDYQTFVSVEKDFSVSDTDVWVFMNGAQILVTPDGLWGHKAVNAVQDRTTPDGRLHLLFGNNSYGARPTPSDEVRIVYAVTSGYDGNSIVTTGQRINPVNAVLGLTVTVGGTQPVGGADQPPAAVLKTVSATSFGTLAAAVTPRQYLATALAYPDVRDVKMFAQREMDTTRLDFMNTIKVVPLFSSTVNTGAPVPQTTKDAFLAYMQERSMFSTRLYIEDPVAVQRTVSVKLLCYNWATLTVCIADAHAAILKLFTPRAGFIGYNISISDIVRAAQGANAGIEYMQVVTPTTDFYVSGEPVAAPSFTKTVGGSTLAAAVNNYMVGVTDTNYPLNPILPKNSVSVSVAAGEQVALSWAPYPNALSYQVYANRGSAPYALIGSVSAPQTTLVDSGQASVGVLPTLTTYPVLYNALLPQSLTVEASYSTRSRAV